jgi:putative two-component system response regulator
MENSVRPAVLIMGDSSDHINALGELLHLHEALKTENAALKTAMAQRMAENDLTQLVSIRALAHLAEIRDPETGNHLLRTQGYVRHLALLLQNHPRFASTLTPHYIDLLARSAPLHDIGKVGIPDNVLLKVGKLNAEEWVIMRTHAKLGSDAIERAEKDIEQPLDFLVLAKEIAHWHHERWDGSGYPDGLAGERIPLSARLMAVADVFDAMISKRIYKAAMPTDQVCTMMAAERGKHFDPDLIDAFIADFERFAAIAEQHREEEEG